MRFGVGFNWKLQDEGFEGGGEGAGVLGADLLEVISGCLGDAGADAGGPLGAGAATGAFERACWLRGDGGWCGTHGGCVNG
jgi:hypothetical protein